MNTVEILRALRAGTIGLDDARKELVARYPSERGQDDGQYAVVVSTIQSPADVSVSHWEAGPPEPGEVTVEVKASAINFADVLCISGLYPTMPRYPFVPGFEVAGVVSSLGAQVSGIAIGDAVIALTGPRMGGHASHVNVPAPNVVRKPADLSFEDACSLPVVFSTVYHAFELAKLGAHEHVLIQSAAGGCGLMALQLAHLQQCVCYATSSRDSKLDLLRRLSVPHLINYKTTDVAREIRRLTSDRGVDVVLNMLSGDAIQQGLDCLAPFGRYLELAVHALKASRKLDLSRLVQNQTIHSIDLRRAGLGGQLEERALLDVMVSMVGSGEIAPVVSRIYPLHQIGDAFLHVSGGNHVGKVVVSHTSQEAVDKTDECFAALARQKQRCDDAPRRSPLVHVRTDPRQPARHEGIAVVGMAGRFPKARSVQELWGNIAQGRHCISEVPAERWSTAEFYDPNRQAIGKSYSKWMGVLEEAEEFDPLFFNISPAEAEWMDPQQRLFLEECWHCIEDAAIRPSALSGTRCGVFVGCGPSDYGRDLRQQGLNAQGLTGGASSILAARIAYFLNLTGPCLAIETACSSSLVAIAQACDSLVARNCDLALAGGVHVMFGPAMHVMTSDAGMLSEDGRCFTFDARANGFVPGEGIGVILIKRLADAIRDGDPIAGVIRGWGVNQDGRTNGITAPSVKSQVALEREVYRRFDIDPDALTLVEAHGTGTALGDPIEVEALTDAFRTFTNRTQYCALGSVKSNIGHLMTAAGVAGVIKVLLALRHRMLPPTINFETPNPHLSLDASPFYVNAALEPWTSQDGTPRRAAVSSFGFSGTNAHLVIEEFVEPARPTGDPHQPSSSRPGSALLTLSARSDGQLKRHASAMREFLRGARDTVGLTDLSYSLQVGRESMEHRLAILADSTESLERLLDDYLGGRPSPAIMTAHVGRNADGIAPVEDEDDRVVLLNRWVQQGQWRKIAAAWVRGAAIDWQRLYPGDRPRRVNVPGYPFAHKRYSPYGSTGVPPSDAGPLNRLPALHPLVHRNTSDFQEQRYTSTYCSDDAFVSDHQIKGQHVVPGVALLEAARFAATDALGARAPGRHISLRKVSWPRPLVISTPVTVHVGLRPTDDDLVAFRVYRRSDGDGAEPLVHCEGIIEWTSGDASTLDLPHVREQCRRGTLSAAECSDAFERMGFRYGPTYQSIEKIWLGADLALAQLRVPASTDGGSPEYVLNPGLIDAAVRATIGLSRDGGEPRPAVPFAMQELTVFAACPARAWAVVRPGAHGSRTRRTHTADIDICREDGTVCISIRGFAMVAGQEAHDADLPAPGGIEISVFRPHWIARDLSDVSPGHRAPDGTAGGHLVVLCHVDGIDPAEIENQLGDARCIILGPTRSELPQTYADDCRKLLEAIQAIQRSRPKGPVLIQLAGGRESEPILHGLGGLLKTAQLESSTIRGQVIHVDGRFSVPELVAVLKAEALDGQFTEVRYDDETRWVAAWQLATVGPATVPWRPGGVYVISGGAGRLGLLLAQEIAGRTEAPNIILVGRSELDPVTADSVERINALGAHVVYRTVDVADRPAVDRLIAGVVADFGTIHGIVHAAGIVRDSYIHKKIPDDLTAVLAPKVSGIVNLDLASRDIPLDVFIVFSSFAGAMGNVGQADYAAANAFMDGYARRRASLVAERQAHGRTLSINWPLWRDGGMRVDAATETRMTRGTGLVPLETGAGFDILYRCLAGDDAQLMVLPGDSELIIPRLFPEEAGRDRGADLGQAAVTASTQQEGREELTFKVERVLVQAVSSLLRIDADEIDLETELSEFGLDSISFAKLAGQIGEQYGIELAPTVFFEHRTVDGLARFLIEDHHPTLAAHHARTVHPLEAERTLQQPDGRAAVTHGQSSGTRFATPRTGGVDRERTATAEPVAVIGMSGRFPKAPDLRAFWENLAAGRDCIDDIPASRWDWREPCGDAGEDGRTATRYGGFIEGVDEFDPFFFGISPAEAELMDPQQRLLMMYAWRAIEDAGYAPRSLSGTNLAIIVGTGNTGYSNLLDRANVAIKGYSATGSVPSVGPNRLSFLLDVHGPSEPIETACSSSLVAIHRALQAIEQGLCDTALAGGVNTIVTRDAHIGFAKAGMLSERGRCSTFSDRADGYVRGEGVGMLLLKRLTLAERDGDHIYGLLLASAENHGGRATSLTAPNPKAQADLLESAYARAGIDPHTVGYIEAHGTGTPLGDPVEVDALKSAFTALYRKSGDPLVRGAHCGIGSVKTNIGHLELAAGVAGVIKVLLQIEHKTLAKSLHSETLNPHIELRDTPFYVVRRTMAWKAIQDASGQNLPRRAGVSSFGFGGVNAHVVIQEYVETRRQATAPTLAAHDQDAAVILLSARTDAQLRQRAQDLLDALERGSYADRELHDIAYTLQVGRDAMEERLAFIVPSLAALKVKLAAFLEGADRIEDLYRGRLQRGKDALSVFTVDDDLQGAVDAWFRKRKYDTLLDLWSKGLAVDWTRLHGGVKRRRISLPTYPFARDRYWVPDGDGRQHVSPASMQAGAGRHLHPLVHHNTSDLSEQRYTTTFSGNEFFLTDHVIRGQKVLPGVIHLEMARAGLQMASSEPDACAGIRLEDVRWRRPLVVEDRDVHVHLALHPEPDGHVSFEVYGRADGEEGGPAPAEHIYSQGRAQRFSAGAPPSIDLAGLRVQCRDREMTAQQCYAAFADLGIAYGPAHQGIERIFCGAGQVLARVVLRESPASSSQAFVLHPCLMDAALQAIIGLAADRRGGALALPFALREVEIFAACPPRLWAWIRYAPGSGVDADPQSFDLDLAGEDGAVCVRIKGLAIRTIDAARRAPASEARPDVSAVAERGAAAAGESLSARIALILRQEVSTTLKVKVEDIDVDTELDEYGFDSITLTEFASHLNRTYDLQIAPTLFFELPTVATLAPYLAREYERQFVKCLGIHHDVVVPADAPRGTPDTTVEADGDGRARVSQRMRRRIGRSAVETYERQSLTREPLAVVGMSGRFPMAGDLKAYWTNLLEGKDCIQEIPRSRWDWREYYGDPAHDANKTNIKWGGFMDGVDEFDPLFFGIPPAEAEVMDPQQRLLMMYVWQVLEDAGYAPSELAGSRTGIFVGTGHTGYGTLIERASVDIRGYSSTGSVPSIGPNRMSYFLNLRGPSEPIETACSSSLVALHRAMAAIHAGECDMAIAGGVNTIVTPDSHIGFSKAGMLSPAGQCKTFSDQADGYVRGEGVGMLLLKRLSRAEADGDHIYGLLRGSAVSHGGRTSSLTAPSARAQADLLEAAYRQAGIDPRTVTYIEAHGTGTSLGDPIEIDGLTAAFSALYEQTGGVTVREAHCGLGSVKTNIGHLELAAGVAGVFKVLLQLKHETLVKSRHCERVNPYIRLDGTPFYLVGETQPWKSVIDQQGAPLPRRAGVSSFGFGGVNAHVIIEEYVPSRSAAARSSASELDTQQHVIVLSARNDQRLLERVVQLLDALDSDDVSSSSLPSIAYTLQVGREALEERLGLIVHTLEELRTKLRAYVDGRGTIANVYRGQVKRHKDTLAVFTADEEFAAAVNKWIAKGQLATVLDLWTKGVDVPWKELHGDATPPRISLPGYPFAKDKYWVPAPQQQRSNGAPPVGQALHPLLHLNCSELNRQRYRSVFTGQEFFFTDHAVEEQRMFPGVAYLEMALQAVLHATGTASASRIVLRNIVWSHPIVARDEPLQVHLDLHEDDGHDVHVEIYTGETGRDGDRLVHARASARLLTDDRDTADIPVVDVSSSRSACGERQLTAAECYAALSSIGLHYGPAFRCLKELHSGSGQVFARLSLPDAAAKTWQAYVLHPSLMDAALQASVGLLNGSTAPAVPFALEALEVFGPCPPDALVSIRAAARNGNAGANVHALDVEICDQQGRVCVQMRGLSTRAISGDGSAEPETVAMYKPIWVEREIAGIGAVVDILEHVVLLCDVPGVSASLLTSELPGARCRVLTCPEGTPDRVFTDLATRIFEEVRALVRTDARRPTLVQVIVPGEVAHGCLRALSGFARSARLEHQNLFVQLIEIDGGATGDDVIDRLRQARGVPHLQHIVYRGTRSLVMGWEEIAVAESAAPPWKHGGVYLITGGTGRLAQCFARDIATSVSGARIILAGRSMPHEDRRGRLAGLTEADARIEYRVLDVTVAHDCAVLIRTIVETHGALDGIIHAAGVVHDSLIKDKTPDEWREVLAPKVAGLANLDEASRDVLLDFFVVFSSLTSVAGNRGQADYAAANAFMDAYMSHRRDVTGATRHGKSLSINWPLWRDGGMRVDHDVERLMRRRAGLVPLQTFDGLSAFYQGLAADTGQLLVVSGKQNLIRRTLLGVDGREGRRSEPASSTAAAARPAETDEALAEKLRHALGAMISALLHVDIQAIDPDGEWNEYGFDSITLTELTNLLNRTYQLDLVPIVLFEHPTVRALSRHLADAYREPIAKHLTPDSVQPPVTTRAASSVGPSAPARTAPEADDEPRPRTTVPPAATHATTRDMPAPVAVIGISGCFPKAPDLDAFWQNLVDGTDCISEVPPSRWDWRELYGDARKEPNKTRIRWGGFVDGIDEFDPLFFGISPSEAEAMDPQQRLLMTHVWRAIEDAGYAPQSLSGSRTAIFVGTGNTGYGSLLDRAHLAIQGYSSMGAVPSIGPNRMSYLLNLRGPSEPVETACSSSLVALHHALQAIESGSCDAAIVGGVNTIPTPGGHIGFDKAGMLSDDGRCRTFSEQASGYVRGEGVGMLFIKRQTDAEQDGDHVYGVIRGSAENHGGRASSLTAPNPSAQADLIVSAYTHAGIDPRTVGYIEAHGTGTKLGDPIEISALKSAFAALSRTAGGTEVTKYCGLGSVKSNIGHLELAAGVASVLKVLLQLKHRKLVRTLHCEPLNPYLQLDDSPFYVVQELQDWEAITDAQGRALPRRAGVSSFGFGGVNAHVVIEEYIPSPAAERPSASRGRSRASSPVAIVLSARTAEQLTEQVRQLLNAMRTARVMPHELIDIAYTLQVGRDAMEERLAVIVESTQALEQKLDAFLAGQPGIADLFRGQVRRGPHAVAEATTAEAVRFATEAWLVEGHARPLLELWIQGATVEWHRLYSGTRPQRRRLPTYPFARNRYWISAAPSTTRPAAAVDDGSQPRESTARTDAGAGGPGPERAADERRQMPGHAKRVIHEQIKDVVRECVAKALNIDERDIHDDRSFAEYGVDSIVGVNVINEINDACASTLSTIVLFDYNTVSALGEHIATTYPAIVERVLEHAPNEAALYGEARPIDPMPRLEAQERLDDSGRQPSTRQRTAAPHPPAGLSEEPIAIVGLSGRFSGAASVQELWQHLVDGHDLVKEVTRWDLSRCYADVLPGDQPYCTHGSLVDEIDEFDARFFRISPLEARYMDPQQRLLLEESWKALEDAGYAGDTPYHQRCGVYVGCAAGDYERLFTEQPPAQAFWGNAASVIPARIAYFLNLQGAVMAIDTACSSSLVAIHVACQGLWRREIDMALAGGVHVQSTPTFYVLTSRGGMLSPTGRCHTFGDRADGFVPGEGVGVVVLKRLADAQADGDHVYGVIKGTGINQDGATNGITAPSSLSQERLLCGVYERYQIDPDTIQMVEAHGTGTRLGDPIEFEALTRAFRRFTSRRGYCALGSIKTNVGHTATAAGVAGVIKAVLSLHHKTIPASLHCERPNPRIDVAASPFFINTKTRAWEAAEGEPRCAAVSSFGFSGTNAHLVIEQAPAPAQRPRGNAAAHLIVLSARTADQLRQQVEQLCGFITHAATSDSGMTLDCGDISHTLLLGRRHFGNRLACIVRDQRDLLAVLRKWLTKGSAANVYAFEIDDRNRREQPEALKRYGDLCLQQCARGLDEAECREKLAVVAELYVQGYALDFATLFSTGHYQRLSLPTYPFARESFWVQTAAPAGRGRTAAADRTPGEDRTRPDVSARPGAVRPLLRRDASDRAEWCYVAAFTGDEPFLRDHVVDGHRVLPAVVFLEMARAAVVDAFGAGQSTRVRLRSVVWSRPVSVHTEPTEARVRLRKAGPGEHDGIVCDISTRARTANSPDVTHCQCVATIVSPGSAGRTVDRKDHAVAPVVDIEAVRAECSRETVAREAHYARYRQLGIEYGPSHRAVEHVYVGDTQALAELALPVNVSAEISGCVLHPGLLDGALQATLCLMMKAGDVAPALPFALQELDVWAECAGRMWAWVRTAGEHGGPVERRDEGVQRFDLDLCDDSGVVRVALRGFSVRRLPGPVRGAPVREARVAQAASDAGMQPEESAANTLMLLPVWDAVTCEKAPASPSDDDRVIVVGADDALASHLTSRYRNLTPVTIGVGETSDDIARRLSGIGQLDHIIWIAPEVAQPPSAGDEMIAGQQAGVLQLVRIVKALLGLQFGRAPLAWTLLTYRGQAVHASDRIDPTHAGVHGLAGSMAKEYEHWKVRVLDLPSRDAWLQTDIATLPFDAQGNALVWRGGQWYRQKMIPVDAPSLAAESRSLYRHRGTYVVVGGAGGIGVAWSEYLVRRYQAQIVWIGRRPADAAIEAKIASIRNVGPAPIYISADAADGASLERAYDEIKRRVGAVNGIVHSAIVLRDQSLATLTEEHFGASLAAKVDTSVHTARVFRSEPLDFFLFFSSLNSFNKGPGQSSYAAGCLFEDAFARYLAQTRDHAVRVMNWGYWGSIGIVASAEHRQRMARHGIGSIEPADAMEPLEHLLSGPIHQLGLMKTVKALPGIEYSEQVSVRPARAGSRLAGSFVERALARAADRAEAARETAATLSTLTPLDALLSDLLFAQLRSMGLDGKELPLGEVRQRCGITPRHDRWLQESLAILAHSRYLSVQEERCTLLERNVPGREALWEQWNERKAAGTSTSLEKAMMLLAQPALEALPDVLRGVCPPTDVLFPRGSMDLVERLYKFNPVAHYFNTVLADCVVACVQARMEDSPLVRLRILEIGAGTGGASAAVLAGLEPYQDSIAEYCYTDMSQAFLIYAQKAYGSWNPFLRYAILDVARPLAAQGLAPGTYDIVIASNVIHATRDVRLSLRHIKEALVRGGVVVLNELSSVTLFTHLTFGLLDGWWLYEDADVRLPGGPAVASQTWQAILETEGFGRVSFPARNGHDLGLQLILAESDGISRQPSSGRAIGSASNARPAEAEGAARERGGREDARPAAAYAKAPAAIAAVLRDRVRDVICDCLAQSVDIDVQDIRYDRFVEYGIDSIIAVKLMTSLGQRLGLMLETTLLFDYDTIEALTEYVSETYSNELSSFLIARNAPFLNRAASAAVTMTDAPAATTTERVAVEPPPAAPGVSTGRKTGVARSTEAPSSRESIATVTQVVEGAPADAGTRYYRVLLARPGRVDDVRVEQAECRPLLPRELRVAVKAFSLNFGDLLCVKGLYPTMPPYPFTPGFEASGIVAEVGAAVTSVMPGDAVIVGTGDSLGGHATMIVCSEDQVFLKPDALSFEEASAMPAVSVTVLDAFRRARLRRGERILIQTATGGTGLMAVQLARHYGAEILATAGSQHKLDYLATVGVPHRINYLETDFEAEVRRLTHGQGVDVVINTLPGDAMQKGLRCLRSGGRYIEIAMTALKAARAIDLSVLNDNQAFHSIDLRKLARADPAIMKEHRDEFLRLVNEGVLRATIHRTFSLDSIKAAYSCLENRQHIGKVVVSIREPYAYGHGGACIAAGARQQTGWVARHGLWRSPELVRLNGDRQGRPVFWFHGGLGGVEMYQPLAQQIQRPFFGVQARGWMSDRPPIVGIHAMADHYAGIIGAVQHEGPYDLGGYSLGGVLAYEVARRLQGRGEPVGSIVMLDSPDSTHLGMFTFTKRTVMLQAVNTALFSTITNQPEKLVQVLVHRDEPDASADDETFVQHLVGIAQQRGMFKDEAPLRLLVQQSAKLHAAYELEKFKLEPLGRPEEIAVYYFRKRSRQFWGALEPYITMTADEVSLDNTNYWGDWVRQLPNLQLIDVESSSHLTLLTEPKASAVISRFCARLYSGQDMSGESRDVR